MGINVPRTVTDILFQKFIKPTFVHKYKWDPNCFKLIVTSEVNKYKHVKDFLRNLILIF
jgi:hypothetical protein